MQGEVPKAEGGYLNLQNIYLKAMGIEVWRGRLSKPPKNQLKIIELKDKRGSLQAYLLIPALPESLSPEALKLLDAMLTAIELHRASESIDISSLAHKPSKPILLLGEKLAQDFLRSPFPITQLRGQCHYPSTYPAWAIFPSFGLEAILANPKLKRLVWDDLRLFQKALS